MWPVAGSWHAWPSRCGECRRNDPAPEVFNMAAPSSCPPTEGLRRLLHGTPPAPDQSDLIAHLDHCAPCQRALEELAGVDPALLSAANSLKRTFHPPEAPLRRLLVDLDQNSALSALQ